MKKIESFLNGVKEFCKLCLIGFFVSFIVIGVPGVIILSWDDEENIERCMQEFPGFKDINTKYAEAASAQNVFESKLNQGYYFCAVL